MTMFLSSHDIYKLSDFNSWRIKSTETLTNADYNFDSSFFFLAHTEKVHTNMPLTLLKLLSRAHQTHF